MKIAIASTYLGQAKRGIESWAADLAAELHRRGADVALFRGGGPGALSYERYLRCADSRRACWRAVTGRWGWRLGLGSPATAQQMTFGWRLAWALRRGRFDLVHIQDPWLGRVLETARRRGVHRAQVIFMHGTEEDFTFLSRFQYVQEQAPWYLEQHRQHGLPPGAPWFVIPSFVDCARFSPGDGRAARAKFGLPADRFIVLDVAALRLAHKRLDWLIREVATLRRERPDALLVVAGAPTTETSAVEQLARAELGEHCRLLPGVQRADMPDLYRAADVVAHPSLRELFGLVFVEALACGTPVIGHTFPVTQWIIGPGGTTVDMEQPGHLARTLAGNEAQRRAWGNAAREHVLQTFETGRVVDQYGKMYEQVLAHG